MYHYNVIEDTQNDGDAKKYSFWKTCGIVHGALHKHL